jgi:hypothetical protein
MYGNNFTFVGITYIQAGDTASQVNGHVDTASAYDILLM